MIHNKHHTLFSSPCDHEKIEFFLRCSTPKRRAAPPALLPFQRTLCPPPTHFHFSVTFHLSAVLSFCLFLFLFLCQAVPSLPQSLLFIPLTFFFLFTSKSFLPITSFNIYPFFVCVIFSYICFHSQTEAGSNKQ
ncbi:hypothetical protein GPALN_005671 [Globodera pallida]|nr:hypothetical protein GPALN_005671 [Globodera pallida]